MKRAEAEMQERTAQIQREIQALREQLAAWRERPAEAIRQNYPTVYVLHQTMASRAVERRALERSLPPSIDDG